MAKKNKKNKKEECVTPLTNKRKDFIKIKDKDMTLEERIYSLPPGTWDFDKNREYQLEKAGLMDKYDKEYIMVSYPKNEYCHETYSKKNLTYVGLYNDEIGDQYLGQNSISVRKRSQVEYTPYTLQLVGGCIMLSPSFIAVLKSTTGRLKDKLTMIQGHVDYDASFINCKSIQDHIDFVKKNTVRELEEEVKVKGESLSDIVTMSEQPKFVINKYSTLIDMEHIGFIFEAHMSDEDILKLKSNEKDKHEVFIINKETLAEQGKEAYAFDSWLTDVITMVTE